MGQAQQAAQLRGEPYPQPDHHSLSQTSTSQYGGGNSRGTGRANDDLAMSMPTMPSRPARHMRPASAPVGARRMPVGAAPQYSQAQPHRNAW